jgi:hypothetical protein
MSDATKLSTEGNAGCESYSQMFLCLYGLNLTVKFVETPERVEKTTLITCLTRDAIESASFGRGTRRERLPRGVPIVQTLSAPTPALSMRAKPCARWLHAIEKYALEERSNTVLAAEYRTTLPHDRLLAEEIAQTRRQLNLQRQNAFRALPRRRRARHSRSRRAWQGHHLIAEGGRRLGGASQITAAAEPLSLHR